MEEGKKSKAFVKKYILIFCTLALSIIITLFVYVRFDQKEKSFENTSAAMGTYVQQTVFGKNSEKIATKTALEINNLENLISYSNESSDIAKINNAAGKYWIDISPQTVNILLTSLEVSRKSMGMFDPTILPVTSLWGFSSGCTPRLPEDNEIKKALKGVNCENLRVNEDVQRAKLFSGISALDLSGVEKGAACDTAIELYSKYGAKAGIIAIDDSVGVYGKNPGNPSWRIAIRDPYKNEGLGENMAILQIKSGCVSTSGSYEKYFKSDSKVYHNIINPKTGYPVDTDLISVTITNKSGLISDILSEACFALERQSSSYLLNYYNAGAVFVYKNKDVYVTNNIKSSIIITNNEYTLRN